MPIDRKLLQQVKQAMYKLAQDVTPPPPLAGAPGAAPAAPPAARPPAAPAPAPAPAPAAKNPAGMAGAAAAQQIPKVDPNWDPKKFNVVQRPKSMPYSGDRVPAGLDETEMNMLQSWNNRIGSYGSRNIQEVKDFRALNDITRRAEAARQAYMRNPDDPKAATEYGALQRAYNSQVSHVRGKYVSPMFNPADRTQVRRYNERGMPVMVAGKPAYEAIGPQHKLLNNEQLKTLEELMGFGSFQVPLPERAPPGR